MRACVCMYRCVSCALMNFKTSPIQKKFISPFKTICLSLCSYFLPLLFSPARALLIVFHLFFSAHILFLALSLSLSLSLSNVSVMNVILDKSTRQRNLVKRKRTRVCFLFISTRSPRKRRTVMSRIEFLLLLFYYQILS